MLMVTIDLGRLQFQLKDDFDFSFIKAYGEPFKIYDDQDSGNLCFGVESAGKRLFLKLAGAPTTRGLVSGQEAIERLMATVSVYHYLQHPLLTPVVETKTVPGGYLMVQDWFDGVCMVRQYGNQSRFLQLPIRDKLEIYARVLEFHQHVHEKGYIAIDFYDGCVLYNFDTKQVMLCDVEFYQKKPVRNTMGRMWGSSRYMSPEEFILGAVIDERSNIFCMGALAFELMGGGAGYLPKNWEASQARYTVALKAVNPDRAERYPSVAALMEAWYRAE